MKNIIIVFALLLIGWNLSAQQWKGSNTTDDNVYRNGNVGIGMSKPLEKLHINGNLKMEIGEGFKVFGDQNYFGKYLDGIIFQMEDINNSKGNTDGGFIFRGYTTKDKVASKEWMVVRNGNVGIGMSKPLEKLHINGNLKMEIGEGFKVFGDQNYFGKYLDGIIFQMEDINNSKGNTDGGFIFRGYTTKDKVASKEWMVIRNGGSVGIGTTNPGAYKLAVNGKVRAKEVVVETGWSDFVFEKDYKLPTLKEVEQHIKKHGHLKDIPSAKEVAEKGVKLGQMDSKLLQKIEELTLYIIDQNKQIKFLKDQNRDLIKITNELQELKKQIKKNQ